MSDKPATEAARLVRIQQDKCNEQLRTFVQQLELLHGRFLVRLALIRLFNELSDN